MQATTTSVDLSYRYRPDIQLSSSIVQLDLSCNSLPQVPSDIECLPLKILNLNHNNISHLRALPLSLTHLLLQGNAIEDFDGLPPLLSVLNLAENQLTAVPAKLVTLSLLENLQLNSNRLTEFDGGLPPSLLSLTLSDNPLTSIKGLPLSLNSINLSQTELVSIPAEFSILSRLEVLKCHSGKLEEIIGLPSSLRDIDVPYCALKELPKKFSNLEHLQKLNVKANHLSSLPPLPVSLTQLVLCDNQLAELADLHNLTQLEELSAHENKLESIGGLPPSLKELSLFTNQLKELPNMSSLKNLEILMLGQNKLERIDSLPPSLKVLSCEENCLTRPPTNIKELTNLEQLNLSNNPLIQLDQLPASLRRLELAFASLHNLPTYINLLSQLEFLDLSGNSLSSLPPLAPSLKHIVLSRNHFQEIPQSLHVQSSLKRLELDHNSLLDFPLWVGLLPSLTKLSLSFNPLSNTNITGTFHENLSPHELLGLSAEETAKRVREEAKRRQRFVLWVRPRPRDLQNIENSGGVICGPVPTCHVALTNEAELKSWTATHKNSFHSSFYWCENVRVIAYVRTAAEGLAILDLMRPDHNDHLVLWRRTPVLIVLASNAKGDLNAFMKEKVHQLLWVRDELSATADDLFSKFGWYLPCFKDLLGFVLKRGTLFSHATVSKMKPRSVQLTPFSFIYETTLFRTHKIDVTKLVNVKLEEEQHGKHNFVLEILRDEEKKMGAEENETWKEGGSSIGRMQRPKEKKNARRTLTKSRSFSVGTKTSADLRPPEPAVFSGSGSGPTTRGGSKIDLNGTGIGPAIYSPSPQASPLSIQNLSPNYNPQQVPVPGIGPSPMSYTQPTLSLAIPEVCVKKKVFWASSKDDAVSWVNSIKDAALLLHVIDPDLDVSLIKPQVSLSSLMLRV
eukprot:TRINITY_DN4278_c0_g1_i1.p1 TRINITY_DN4278_c0_g1~~TRINITY_DN4278_c0_g1_i1.p1  ORF type:complete len:906 (-),score=144.58 TRINITY_DN4278_c0_g1_i1:97-2814(-)